MNVHNFKRVMKAIAEAKDHEVDMYSWHSGCGTAHCIAGWCDVLSDHAFYSAHDAGIGFLGVTKEQSARLFHFDAWPAQFRAEYSHGSKRLATLARLKHFIETLGRE